MKLALFSDIHLEFMHKGLWQPPSLNPDVVILAGDIGKHTKGIEWARLAFPDSRIIYVAGNHEFYNGSLLDLSQMREAAGRADIDFLENDSIVIAGVRFIGADLAPISVIITTLAGWAYAKCATQMVHSDAFDFITAVIREMPTFIRIEMRSGQQHFVIENETTAGENFADKWNSDPRLAAVFYEWQRDALTSVESLLQVEGVDQFAESLSNKFGAKKEHVREILTGITNPIGQARSAGLLGVAPALGLIASLARGSVVVPKNTFFGR